MNNSSFPPNPSSLLTQIKAKVTQLQRLNTLVNCELGATLKQNCRVANLRDNILIMEVDSSAWATRLRYVTPELLQRLRKHKEFNRLQEIQWYIRPLQAEKATPDPLTLSKENAEFMEAIAKHLDNPTLQNALLKLASHTKGSSKNTVIKKISS